MIASLSKSFRTFVLNDACAKSILASVQPLCTQVRFKSDEEKPTKPLAPYYRFANENRASMIAKHPKLKSFEIDSILLKVWQSLEAVDRQKFIKEYKTDLINYYSNEFKKSRSSLSTDDKRNIKEIKIEIEKRRILAAQQRKLRKLGKPKRPLSSFFRFLAAQKDRQLNEPYKDYHKRVKARWNALTETEKGEYKTSAEELATFKKALLQWEQKMEKLEHDGVIDRATKQTPRNSAGSKK